MADPRTVNRNQYGKWIYCLAQRKRRARDTRMELVEMTEITTEGEAVIYFEKYLESSEYFLIKIQIGMACLIMASGRPISDV